jgi:hypothetical protein
MPYYPKNRIVTNLYTNGNEFVVVDTLLPYTGFYYKVYNGTFYTGKNPQENDLPQQLVPLIANAQGLTSPVVYSKLVPNRTQSVRNYIVNSDVSTSDRKIPIPFYPTPSQNDYQNGSFTRYFAKKINNLSFIEIDSTTYSAISSNNSEYLWELYNVIEIPWQLTGDKNQVYETNRKVTHLAEKNNNFQGLNQFLKFKFSKFYQ